MILDKKDKSVLVLDSGIGGMTVVKAIREINNAISITYISDNAFFPYGRLETRALMDRVHRLVEQALDRFSPDTVVIACNTASTLVLEELRASFSVPFVGLVPPVKTAGEISRSRVIGLLATEGTVQRSYIDTLIENFAPDCHIHRVGCPDLAPMAEEKVRGWPVDKARLREALRPLEAPELSRMDVVILGCTHYPFLREELEEVFGRSVEWLDPALPVARQVMRVLDDVDAVDRVCQRGQNEVFFTNEHCRPEDMSVFLEQMGFSGFRYWTSDRSFAHCDNNTGTNQYCA